MGVIEEQRKELKLTQEEVAQKLGISRQYYNLIENNKKKPSVTLAKQLSNILGVDWTIFFT
ncbi:putative transcriptional regulator [Halobacillus karajensis]|uniref:helix-turn-helix transcriptional regulator n=1 Tax=Halobacillus karajensis TaxID=195088 RepID=UPI0008A7585B|nr:helix-turn-helix transcriptional regulator [Halobacillus karajensis]SEH77718.1 putative transcriptional regulator [Halobacillus karajensis]